MHSHPARASECAGDPAALGTSRTLVVDPAEHPRVGTMQYSETLPLEDHEVVLTFDDGPQPRHTNPVLDILSAQCVKATFFIVGKMAHEHPATVRRIRDEGHSIGTHSQTHPMNLDRMPLEQAKAEIDDGIFNAAAALGGEDPVAPFFRIPGLLRSEPIEQYLLSRGIMTWSADFPADDWHRISPARIVQTAMTRLDFHGRGILLLHDIQSRTQAALPALLRELKIHGYRIVHVVPASATQPKTPTLPSQWQLHPPPLVTSDWPSVPTFKITAHPLLAAPELTAADGTIIEAPVRRDRQAQAARRGVPRSLEPLWPRPDGIRINTTAEKLAAPDPANFEIERALALKSMDKSPDRVPSGIATSHHSEEIARPITGRKSADALPVDTGKK